MNNCPICNNEATREWTGSLEAKMPEYLQKSLHVREQLGFALNRIGRSKEAERVLRDSIAIYGNSSETLRLLGRIYRDKWEDESNSALKESWSHKAIDTYVKGFKSDTRDAYPGAHTPNEQLEALLPVVLLATKQRVKQSTPDYWDCATLMELEVIAHNPQGAKEALLKALPQADEDWMKKTTRDTMEILRDKWKEQGQDVAWLDEIVEGLR